MAIPVDFTFLQQPSYSSSPIGESHDSAIAHADRGPPFSPSI
jgi:hypothetical protein